MTNFQKYNQSTAPNLQQLAPRGEINTKQDPINPFNWKVDRTSEGFVLRNYVDPLSGSGSMGGTSRFQIPKVTGRVTGFVAEFTMSSTATLGVGGAYNFIQQLNVVAGSKKIFTCSGIFLKNFLDFQNANNQHVLDEINVLSGFATALQVSGNKLYVLIPVCGFMESDYSHSGNMMQRSYPIGRSSSDLTLEFILNAGALCSTTSIAVAISAMRVYYWYHQDNDIVVLPNTSQGFTNLWECNSFYVMENSYPVTGTTGGTSQTNQLKIDDLILDGLADGMFLACQPTLVAQGDSQLFSSPITALTVTVGTEKVYESDSYAFNKVKSLIWNRAKSNMPSQTSIILNTGVGSKGNLYFIPFTNQPNVSSLSNNVGSEGLSLLNNKPILSITWTPLDTTNSPYTTAYQFWVAVVYKAKYFISGSKQLDYSTKQ